uniref:Uncharacterized protein n=1 Tax=Anopheles atroparvus TaxID=41427 RepID=A0A182IUI5_ANOAO
MIAPGDALRFTTRWFTTAGAGLVGGWKNQFHENLLPATHLHHCHARLRAARVKTGWKTPLKPGSKPSGGSPSPQTATARGQQFRPIPWINSGAIVISMLDGGYRMDLVTTTAHASSITNSVRGAAAGAGAPGQCLACGARNSAHGGVYRPDLECMSHAVVRANFPNSHGSGDFSAERALHLDAVTAWPVSGAARKRASGAPQPSMPTVFMGGIIYLLLLRLLVLLVGQV